MTGLPMVLTSSAACAAMDYARDSESESIFNHSVRSFLFAELRARHEGLRPGSDYNQEAVFFACVLHDLGAGSRAAGLVRFEVEGADLAAEFLTELGYGAPITDSVWEAIALHTCGGIAERRGPTCYLVRSGISMDFGRDTEFLDDSAGADIHRRYPRLQMERALVDAVVAHASRTPRAAPLFSMSAHLLRERRLGEMTSLERDAHHSRWGA